jgi:hypothetical protein
MKTEHKTLGIKFDFQMKFKMYTTLVLAKMYKHCASCTGLSHADHLDVTCINKDLVRKTVKVINGCLRYELKATRKQHFHKLDS